MLYDFFSPEKNEDIKLVTNNTEIEKVRSCKYLGIYIDDELNWHVHIDYIVGFVAAAVSMSMGGCRAIRVDDDDVVSLVSAVTVDVLVAAKPAVL